jgi:TRAP-type C4-dicarboxylate transport system permease small subunit
MTVATEHLSQRLRTISAGLNRLVWSLSGALLTIMLALIVIQIVGRYLLDNAPSWTEEAARFAMIWSGLLGAAAAFHDRADPVIVAIGDHHPVWMRRAGHWATLACVLAFLGPLIVYSPGFLERAMLRTSESLGWNLGLIVAIVPVYASIVLVQSLLRLAVFETSPKLEHKEDIRAENAPDAPAPGE